MCVSLLAARLFVNVSHKMHGKFVCEVDITVDKKRKIIQYMIEERHQYWSAFRILLCVLFFFTRTL
jgi:hypothetical protein